MRSATQSTIGLAAFLATLVAVVLLSKIGGTGADLAIMTGLIGVLGMLAPGLVPSRGTEQRKVQIDQPEGQPVPVETMPGGRVGVNPPTDRPRPPPPAGDDA